MTMNERELYKRANEEMTRCYESGVRCMETAETERSVRFFRDFTEGEIEAISYFSQTMYLAMIYDHDNEDKEEESRKYNEYCIRMRERTTELQDKIIRHAVRFF